MTTLASPSVLVPCSHQCGHAVRLPAGSNAEPVCERCRRSDTLADAAKIADDVRALAAGTFPFEGLSVEQREEQLQGILFAMESADPLFYPGLKRVDNLCLLGLASDPQTPQPILNEAVAELTRRLSAPTPDERDEIEQRCVSAEQEEPARWDCCI